jgi:DnaK suppressor protein
MMSPRVGIADVSVVEQRHDVRRMLVEHRRELLNEIRSRVRDVREEGAGEYHRATDVGETLEAEPENGLAFALIQLKTEALEKVNDAVHRFDEGTYGCCVDCGEEIAASRMRAMPFAIRCKDCEEMREHSRHRERIQLHRVSQPGLGSSY